MLEDPVGEGLLCSSNIMCYILLRLLITCAHIFIILGGDKKKSNCSINFLSIFSMDISVELVPRFFRFWCCFWVLSFWEALKYQLCYTVLMMPFSLASLTSGHSFPLEFNPSSSLTLNSAEEPYQSQWVVCSLTDVLACWLIIFLTLLWAPAQNEGNNRMFFCHPACKVIVSGGDTFFYWRWTFEYHPETPFLC